MMKTKTFLKSLFLLALMLAGTLPATAYEVFNANDSHGYLQHHSNNSCGGTVTNPGMVTSTQNLLTIGEDVTVVQGWTYRNLYDSKLKFMPLIQCSLYSFYSSYTNITSLTWNAIDCPTPHINWESCYAAANMPYDPNQKLSTTFVFRPLIDGSSLEHVTIGEHVKAIPVGLAAFSQITEIRIPESVTSIGDYAFLQCPKLKTIDWQAKSCVYDYHGFCMTYEKYGDGPFSCNNLSRINIGSNVDTIGEYVFNGIVSVDTVVVYAKVPPVIVRLRDDPGIPIPFLFYDDIYSNALLCVPEGSKMDYMNDTIWGQFENIVTHFDGDTRQGDVDGDGRVSIGDLTKLIDMLLSGEANINDCPGADVNSDGDISIADVTELIDRLLSGN